MSPETSCVSERASKGQGTATSLRIKAMALCCFSLLAIAQSQGQESANKGPWLSAVFHFLPLHKARAIVMVEFSCSNGCPSLKHCLVMTCGREALCAWIEEKCLKKIDDSSKRPLWGGRPGGGWARYVHVTCSPRQGFFIEPKVISSCIASWNGFARRWRSMDIRSKVPRNKSLKNPLDCSALSM